MKTVPARPRGRLLPLCLAALAGCATGGIETDLGGMPVIRTVTAGSASPGGGGMATGTATIRYEDEPVLVAGMVGADAGIAWPALVAAFRAEGLAPDGIDPAAGIVSVGKVEWSREHNGRSVSEFLDCGLSATGRPLADDARVVAFLAAQVKDAGNGSSRVVVRMAATAWPRESLSGQTRACVTTGVLERALIDRVRARAAPGATGPVDSRVTDAPVAPRLPLEPEFADLPFSEGDQLRVWISPWDRITGPFLRLRQDSLILGKRRRTAVPVEWIQEVRMKRTRRSVTVLATLAGVAAGITIATTTDVGIGGKHASQGRILNPGLGALAGGLAGALVGTITFGSIWVHVPLDALRPAVGSSSRDGRSP